VTTPTTQPTEAERRAYLRDRLVGDLEGVVASPSDEQRERAEAEALGVTEVWSGQNVAAEIIG
jgi:hypothetical protein